MTQRDEYISSIVQNLGRLCVYDLNKINAEINQLCHDATFTTNKEKILSFIKRCEYSPVPMIGGFHGCNVYPYAIQTARGNEWVFCDGLPRETPCALSNNRIAAIRALRHLSDCGLADAKFAIELIMRDGWEAFIKYYTEA
jgi:hypothetical protein